MGSGASAVGVKRYGPGGEGFGARQRQAATAGTWDGCLRG